MNKWDRYLQEASEIEVCIYNNLILKNSRRNIDIFDYLDIFKNT